MSSRPDSLRFWRLHRQLVLPVEVTLVGFMLSAEMIRNQIMRSIRNPLLRLGPVPNSRQSHSVHAVRRLLPSLMRLIDAQNLGLVRPIRRL
jgi:hypothetical protein